MRLVPIHRYARRTAKMMSKIHHCDVSAISFDNNIPIISDPLTKSNISHAAASLRSNALVAFPTETVYGLGGSALAGSDAIPKIYKAKGRPSDNPLIVHIASPSQLDSLVDPKWRENLPICYSALIERFWPGPLTILFPTVPGELVSEKVTCGLTTVGIRIPSHPVARALLALANVPVAAPSANTSGRPSPTQAVHVDADLATQQDLACILDGGDCTVGLESTVVSALRDQSRVDGAASEVLKVLRLGGISPEDLRKCIKEAGLSEKVSVEFDEQAHSHVNNGSEFIPSTPGMKYKHYSPDAKVFLLKTSGSAAALNISSILSQFQGKAIGLLYLEPSKLLDSFTAHSTLASTISLGQSAESQAQRLFAGLRAMDAAAVDVIFVECVEEVGLGRTIMERLRKSAGGTDAIEVRAS